MTLEVSGPVGDRAWCFVDVERRQVLRTVQHPSLLAVSAVPTPAGRTPDGLSLTLPTGETAAGPLVRSGQSLTGEYWGRAVSLDLLDGPHAALVSAYLGKPVRLAAAPPGGVVYAGAVSLVGTATLRALAAFLGVPDPVALARRFRPTFLVETDEPHVEEGWVGGLVDLGPAQVRVGSLVPRCAVIDHHPVTGVRDARLLAALAAYRPRSAAGDLSLGVDAEVVVPGVVRAT